jgi:hypothetical protein
LLFAVSHATKGLKQRQKNSGERAQSGGADYATEEFEIVL